MSAPVITKGNSASTIKLSGMDRLKHTPGRTAWPCNRWVLPRMKNTILECQVPAMASGLPNVIALFEDFEILGPTRRP